MNTRRIIYFLFGLLLSGMLYAQTVDSTNSKIPQKDLIDIAKKILRMDTAVSTEQKAGRVYISFIPAAGYSLITKFSAVISTNYAFYTDKARSGYLSVVKFIPLYTLNGQLILPIKATVWTPNNKYNIVSDIRYYRFPQYVYGLGGHTSESNGILLKTNYFSIREAVHKHIGEHLFVGFGYNLDYYKYFSDPSIKGTGVIDYKVYGSQAHSFSSGPSLNILLDNRKNSINPAKGFYGSFVLRPNLTFMGSDRNWQSLVVDLRKYVKLAKYSDNVLAFWAYAWLTFGGDPSYLELPSTGWDAYSNLGRGYIQGRFRGRNLLYAESEYRFGISRNGLFGGVVFANVQSVSEWPSNRFEVLAPATGAGLRVKLNKRSNTNFAVDYGFGMNGSAGLFFSLGEVF
jgi:outer membrane protein assembly factor BamA